MKKINMLILSLVVLFLSACFNDSDEFETFDVDEYHNSEIIDPLYQDLYGEWTLYAMSGGFVGIWEEYSPKYYLSIKPYGIYGYFERSTLKEYGKLTIVEQDSLRLVINMEPDSESPENLYFYDMAVGVQLTGSDTLDLYFYGCDGFNYHYVRQ